MSKFYASTISKGYLVYLPKGIASIQLDDSKKGLNSALWLNLESGAWGRVSGHRRGKY